MNARKLIALGALILLMSVWSQATDKPKTSSLKGKVFHSDTKQPVANASIILLDEKKSDKQDRSVETKTDDQGNYSFPEIAAGKYTVSIRAWYPTQEDAPCQFLMGKTSDKNSAVTVARDKDRFVQQVFIEGFSIKAGKEMTRDFDITCKSMFGG